jgi:hypothetical protein
MSDKRTFEKTMIPHFQSEPIKSGFVMLVGLIPRGDEAK